MRHCILELMPTQSKKYHNTIKTTTLKVKSFQLIQTTNVHSVHNKIGEQAKFHLLHIEKVETSILDRE